MRYFQSIRVFIQKLDGSIEPFSCPMAFVREKPSREEFRNQLTNSPLGNADKDIFFPGWTKNPYVMQSKDIKDSTPTWDEIEQLKTIVDSDEKLHEILDKEEQCPGSTALIVQQTRSKRYSRKKDDSTAQGHGNINSDVSRTRRGMGKTNWNAHRHYNFQASPPFSPTGICSTSGPVYIDPPPYMHFGLIGPMSPSQPYYTSYPPPPCYAVPVNVNFAPHANQYLVPAGYPTGQFFSS